MADHAVSFCTWLEHNRGRSPATSTKYLQTLRRLQAFLQRDLLSATAAELAEFTGIHAHTSLKLTPRARKPLVAAVRGFYSWAHRRALISVDPSADLEYPKTGRPLPRAMSLHSAEALLMQPDMSTFVGVRDAAILGVLIGCGPRIAGVCSLNEEDLRWTNDGGRERLVLRLTEKGGKERLVPAPAETSMLIHAYLGHADLERIDRTLPNGQRVLFVSTCNRLVPPHEYHGEARRIATRTVFDRIRVYGARAGIPVEQLHPHAMRHLFGTEMTESDINLLVHQDLMGHADANSTKIYTSLAIRKKAEAIDKASPMAKIRTPVSALVKRLRER